jgi:hypothetical protein
MQVIKWEVGKQASKQASDWVRGQARKRGTEQEGKRSTSQCCVGSIVAAPNVQKLSFFLKNKFK